MEKLKIYHVETQEDYDDLMVKLEEQGYRWRNGNKPTRYTPITKPPAFIFCRDNQLKKITIRNKRDVEECYLKEVIRYKAKGVEQMEKVVVPQFVADWYEENENSYILGAILDKLEKTKDENIVNWRGSCHGRHKNNLGNAQEVIAKMHMYDYEVEEEKKCYWRKKKEYLCAFEEQEELYLNVNKETGDMFFGDKSEIGDIQTSLAETELKQFVREEDFNKLEKVEIEDV